MHISFFSLLLPLLTLTHATTLTLQLGGQTTVLSTSATSSSIHDFNQTSLGLSGATYPITTCGCTSLEDKQSMCAHIVYDGQPVKFYSSPDCTGPTSWVFEGEGLDSAGAGEVWTCGFWTWSSGSLGLGCPASGA